MKYILGEAVFMRFDKDKGPCKYLCFVQYFPQKSDDEEIYFRWIPLTKDNWDGNQAEKYLHTEDEIYRTVFNYCHKIIHNPDYLEVEIWRKGVDENRFFPMADGSPACLFHQKLKAGHMTTHIMNYLYMAEPIDEYAYLGLDLSLFYKEGAAEVSMRVDSSDIIEKELYEKGADNSIIGISSYFSPSRYNSRMKGRFLVLREEYYVIRSKDEYFLYDSYRSIEKTKHKVRAARFYSEDEALEYALKKVNHIDFEEFEIEKITGKPDYIKRCLREGDSFETYSGKIEESYPYMTIYGCEEPPF